MLHEQAELTGTVHQGVVVPDEGVALAEGQTVKIIIQPLAAAAPEPEPPPEVSSALSPLAQIMLSFAGTVDDWPADFALNHDHYLYGADKRQ